MDSELTQEPYATVAETPSAVVYFAGDRAYKLKKPVDLGFLDFRARQAREAACKRETELNRRFAADVYLGVADLRDPSGRVCDHLVVMRRMPAARRLSVLVRAGEPVADPVRQVARVLALMHAAAPRSAQISQAGGGDALVRRWDDNVRQTTLAGAGLLDAGTVAGIGQLAWRFVVGRRLLLERRISEGRIVDGHGDLLADDIYCLDDGPRILDCLDFDDQLRWLDGLDDAAFLAMDLERLGAADLGRQFTDWYAEFSGDPAPASLRHHFVAYRAFVRAKVACIKAAQGQPAAGRDARQLADLAHRHLRAGAVTLVLIGGLPGTGKSALAGAVADRLGWTVLSSDRIRHELAGVAAPTAASYGEDIYTPAWTQRCYQELLHRAAALLANGESVIADASWISARLRASAAEVAERASADLVQLRCAASADLAQQRMAARYQTVARLPGESDANWDVAERMAAIAQPWPAAITIDTETGGRTLSSAAFGKLVDRALDAVRPHGPEHVWRPTRPLMCPD